MSLNDIKHLAVERIWLVPMAEDGELGYVWCDDPAPGMDMQSEDAVEYVRKDVHETRVAELERERDALAAHVEKMQKVIAEGFESPKDHDYDDWEKEVKSMLVSPPATSLACRDLIKQAEVLEYMGKEVKSMHPKANKDGIAAHLTHVSKGYRQQAEDLTDG